MILLRQLARNVSGCVTGHESGGSRSASLGGNASQGDPTGRALGSSRTRTIPRLEEQVVRHPPRRLGLAACPGVSRPAARLAREHAVEPSPTGLLMGGDAGVYTDRLKRPLDAGLGRSCTLLRRDSPRQRLTQTPEEPYYILAIVSELGYEAFRTRRGRDQRDEDPGGS